jgi:hypothetical protein
MIFQLTLQDNYKGFWRYRQGYACLVEGGSFKWKWVWSA